MLKKARFFSAAYVTKTGARIYRYKFFESLSLFRYWPNNSDKNHICCRKSQKVCEIWKNMLIMQRTLCVKMHISKTNSVKVFFFHFLKKNKIFNHVYLFNPMKTQTNFHSQFSDFPLNSLNFQRLFLKPNKFSLGSMLNL